MSGAGLASQAIAALMGGTQEGDSGAGEACVCGGVAEECVVWCVSWYYDDDSFGFQFQSVNGGTQDGDSGTGKGCGVCGSVAECVCGAVCWLVLR
jgi:hypothetical protein